MKNVLTIFIAVVVVAILAFYMLTYQVRYDEVAILTTFDNADQNSVRREPRLYPKLPPPIQQVTKYSTLVQVFDDQLEEQQTSDNFAVIVRTYMAWKIEDPLAFFKTLKNTKNAETQMRPLLRDVKAIIGKYSFDKLVNTDASQLKIGEIESEARTQLQDRVNKQGFGVTITQVGIRSIVLPEQVTEKVFERMRKSREALAETARAAGRSAAAGIKSEAESAQNRILAFAERRAQAIRAEGDREAAKYWEVFRQDQNFAIFLDQVESMKRILGHNTTFILDPKGFGALTMQNVSAPEPTAEKK